MNFCLVGLSHKTAPVEVREQLAFPEDHLADVLRAAVALPGVSEAFIVSTCNRVEILARAETDDGNIGPTLARFLAESRRRELAEI